MPTSQATPSTASAAIAILALARGFPTTPPSVSL
jgi:hypothetical protein